MQSLVILIPIIITGVLLVFILRKLFKILRLPTKIHEYKKISNILKIIIVSFIIMSIGIIINEMTRKYMYMITSHLNNEIVQVNLTLLLLLSFTILIGFQFKVIILFSCRIEEIKSIIKILFNFFILILMIILSSILFISFLQIIVSVYFNYLDKVM